MQVQWIQSRIGIRNSTVRIPFRYGQACLTRCPQIVVEVSLNADGVSQSGYSGDCLPPSWFDKDPNKDYRHQIQDMLDVTAAGLATFADRFGQPGDFFDGWWDAQLQCRLEFDQIGYVPLLGSFGVSLAERAMIDAICRASGLGFAQAVNRNVLAIDGGRVHAELKGLQPSDWLPARPRQRIAIRHTVGLGDDLTEADLHEERLHDGRPQALEGYLRDTGIRYLKVKVANQPQLDLDRLASIAELAEQYRDKDYHVTLDGNEQFVAGDECAALIRAIRADQRLQTLWANTLLIQQPLRRDMAIQSQEMAPIVEAAGSVPVIIDESDGTLDAYRQAVEVGYRGVSSKNCKGTIKSLLNAGLTRHYNQTRDGQFVMTGEDLCSVGVIPVQADLCLTATLGLQHVERNGHHFHPGLGYMSAQEQAAALEAHPDFYTKIDGVVSPHLQDGSFDIRSFHDQPGFGFSALPDWSHWDVPEYWQFESLGIE